MKTLRLVFVSPATLAAVVCCASVLTFGIARAQAVVTSHLTLGDSGAQVSALQTFLAADSSIYPEDIISGHYGTLTEAAVQRYQCKNGVVCSGTITSTGYGRVGPATLAVILKQEGLPSNSTTGTTTTYPTSGADISAPILSWPSVATTSTTAAIHWNTNEPARNTVLYSTNAPELSYASLAMMSTLQATPDLGTSADATLSGLQPNTLYFYILQSIDPSGNIQYGIDHSFVTSP